MRKISGIFVLAILSLAVSTQADNTQFQIIKDDSSRSVLEQDENGNLWITVTNEVAQALYENPKAKNVKADDYPGLSGNLDKYTTVSVGNWFCTRFDDRGPLNWAKRYLTLQLGSRIKGFYYFCMGPVLD